jgi:D-aminopeptidase
VVDGVPVGRDIAATRKGAPPGTEGSLMAIIATDCPLDSRQLKRVAVRGALGMGRTGAQGGHSSGDYFIAFSTSYRAGVRAGEQNYYSSVLVREEAHLTPLLVAAAEAVEEAILNSIFRAVTVVGRDGNTSEALDMNEMLLIFRRHGRLV